MPCWGPQKGRQDPQTLIFQGGGHVGGVSLSEDGSLYAAGKLMASQASPPELRPLVMVTDTQIDVIILFLAWGRVVV